VGAAPEPAAAQAQLDALNASAAQAIRKCIDAQNLSVDGLMVEFGGATLSVTVSGAAPDQATKEKVLLCCGNVDGVAEVNELMTVTALADESSWHTVVRGDTLSRIAKTAYGNANSYMKILEANEPRLSHPDKIFWGKCCAFQPDRPHGLRRSGVQVAAASARIASA
jgi:nucleoid-associated protein YgaU